MSPRPGHPLSGATNLVGVATRRAAALSGRLVLSGISTALDVLEGSRKAHQTTMKYADDVLQLASSTPLGRLLPTRPIDDGADEEAASIRSGSPRATTSGSPRAMTETRSPAQPAPSGPATGGDRSNGGRPASDTTETADATPDADSDSAATSDAPAKTGESATADVPSPAPTPEIPEAAKEVGAPGAASAEADAAVERAVAEDNIPREPTRAELPLADYDNASLASLRGRLRSLSLGDLAVLREYEQAHAHRLPVVTMLDNRIAKLAADQPQGDDGSSTSPGGSA